MTVTVSLVDRLLAAPVPATTALPPPPPINEVLTDVTNDAADSGI
jgi:hypothetical protein